MVFDNDGWAIRCMEDRSILGRGGLSRGNSGMRGNRWGRSRGRRCSVSSRVGLCRGSSRGSHSTSSSSKAQATLLLTNRLTPVSSCSFSKTRKLVPTIALLL